ncbi:MAG: FAD-dependent oxidoreductase, partial [Fimbriimonadaceae bacterium]|nr:FAD-dependent oxidoreductase [Fimbriimonadaceae bacterium]
MELRRYDAVILGDSLGGCAAALQLLEHGWSVAMIQDFDWIGGQMTGPAVPPDEHPWIEEEWGCTR